MPMHGWYNHQHRRGRVNLPLSIVGRFKCTLFQKSRRSRILLHVLGRFARAGEKEMFHHRIHLRLTHTIAYTSTMLASSTTKSSRNRWSVAKEANHDQHRGRGSLHAAKTEQQHLITRRKNGATAQSREGHEWKRDRGLCGAVLCGPHTNLVLGRSASRLDRCRHAQEHLRICC